MADDTYYYRIARDVMVETRAKDSRFLAHLLPVDSRQDAEQKLVQISRKYKDATHHCAAYRLGHGDGCIYRTDDAGEPAGTAGKPILQAMETRNVSDALLVVTRYFGGTKLGIGGLIRAYRAAAFAVLDAADLYRMAPLVRLAIAFPYQETGAIHKVLGAYRARVLSTQYAEKAFMEIECVRSALESLKREIVDATRGRAEFL